MLMLGTSNQDDIEPWHLGDPTSRLYYLVNRVKGFVTDVATRNAAPFLHRRLYRGYTPPCIVSCFAASLLYTSRTPDNTPMVLRSLHDSIRELVDAEAARLAPATPVEKLARAQALFLYQIIRLLDGDVMLRARGQRDIPLLKSWLADLFRVRENLGDLTKLESSAMRDHPPMNWEVRVMCCPFFFCYLLHETPTPFC
jgi:hypothetical protein